MADKHMKSESTSLVSRECKLKLQRNTTMYSSYWTTETHNTFLGGWEWKLIVLQKTTLQTLTVEHPYSLQSGNATPRYIFHKNVCLRVPRHIYKNIHKPKLETSQISGKSKTDKLWGICIIESYMAMKTNEHNYTQCDSSSQCCRKVARTTEKH